MLSSLYVQVGGSHAQRWAVLWQGAQEVYAVAAEYPLPHATFSEHLRRYRLAAGLSQEALAERAHLSTRAISDLERGTHRAPYRETVRLLAEALSLTGVERAAFCATVPRGPIRVDAGRKGPAPHAKVDHDDFLPGRPGATPVPVPTTAIVGRAADILALAMWLRGDVRLTTLVGPGGVGKTRLALEVVQVVG